MSNSGEPRPGLLVQAIVNGPFIENCYLVADPLSRQGLLIDPGDEEERILEEVRRQNIEVREIANTHAHIDHAGAVAALKRLLGATFALHPAERFWLEQLPGQASMFGLGREVDVPAIDRELEDGAEIAVGSLRARVIHTPGHSPGGCCFYFAEQAAIFVGDTLFAGSIGRTDLPGGSTQQLLAAISERLLALPDDVRVYSGHGPATTIGAERRSNPFLRG